ncbi:hypothetical protein H0H81_007951, partial [Sphagnurus paluster]
YVLVTKRRPNTAPSRPVSPVYQAANRCNMPDQGYINHRHVQDYLDHDGSSEPSSPQEEYYDNDPEDNIDQMCNEIARAALITSPVPISICILFSTLIRKLTMSNPDKLKDILGSNEIVQHLIAQAVSKAKAPAPLQTCPPSPPPPRRPPNCLMPRPSGPRPLAPAKPTHQ